MELKNKSSNSQKSLQVQLCVEAVLGCCLRACQIELNTIKNAINGNHSDLADFKRHGAVWAPNCRH